jgi:hypothetical protein
MTPADLFCGAGEVSFATDISLLLWISGARAADLGLEGGADLTLGGEIADLGGRSSSGETRSVRNSPPAFFFSGAGIMNSIKTTIKAWTARE